MSRLHSVIKSGQVRVRGHIREGHPVSPYGRTDPRVSRPSLSWSEEQAAPSHEEWSHPDAPGPWREEQAAPSHEEWVRTVQAAAKIIRDRSGLDWSKLTMTAEGSPTRFIRFYFSHPDFDRWDIGTDHQVGRVELDLRPPADRRGPPRIYVEYFWVASALRNTRAAYYMARMLRAKFPGRHMIVGERITGSRVGPHARRFAQKAQLTVSKSIVLFKSRRLHFKTEFQGLPISIENRKGSWRRWKDAYTGREGMTKLAFHYGYIRGSEGNDGDHVDCFLGPETTADYAYIVRQVNPQTGEFDEDKVMLGFASMEHARQAYLRHYDDARYLGWITPVSMGELRRMLETTAQHPGMLSVRAITKAKRSVRVKPHIRGGKPVAGYSREQDAASKEMGWVLAGHGWKPRPTPGWMTWIHPKHPRHTIITEPASPGSRYFSPQPAWWVHQVVENKRTSIAGQGHTAEELAIHLGEKPKGTLQARAQALRLDPKRDAPARFTFEDQVGQYPTTGTPGISYYKGVMDAKRHVDCLLWRDTKGKVRGILNHYPQDFFARAGGIYGNMRVKIESKGNINVMVDRQWRHQGIATALLEEADRRWGVNLKQQQWTKEGRLFIEGFARAAFPHSPGNTEGSDSSDTGKGPKIPTQSERLQYTVTALPGRLMIEGHLRPEARTWLDVTDRVIVEGTFDFTTPDKPVYLNRLDAWTRHRGYGSEALRHVLDAFAESGWTSAEGYIESINIASQTMVEHLGGYRIQEKPHGALWRLDLGRGRSHPKS